MHTWLARLSLSLRLRFCCGRGFFCPKGYCDLCVLLHSRPCCIRRSQLQARRGETPRLRTTFRSARRCNCLAKGTHTHGHSDSSVCVCVCAVMNWWGLSGCRTVLSARCCLLAVCWRESGCGRRPQAHATTWFDVIWTLGEVRPEVGLMWGTLGVGYSRLLAMNRFLIQ